MTRYIVTITANADKNHTLLEVKEGVTKFLQNVSVNYGM